METDRLLTSPWINAGDGMDLDAWLVGIATARRLAAGEALFQQGEATGGLYYIREGTVKQVVLSPSGSERQVSVTEPGCIVGEVSALDGGPAQVSAVAMTAVTAWFLPRAEMIRLVRTDGEFALRLMGSLTRKIRVTTKLVSDMSSRPVAEQLACLLHQLARQKGPDRAGTVRVTIAVSHQQLAELLGVSRVTISQGLAALKEQGLIETGHRLIHLLRPAGLRCCGDAPSCITQGPGFRLSEAGD